MTDRARTCRRDSAAARREWRVGLPNLDVRDAERAQELHHPRLIVLRAPGSITYANGPPCASLAAGDLPRAHPPDVVEEVLFRLRRQVERRTRGGQHVFDRFANGQHPPSHGLV